MNLNREIEALDKCVHDLQYGYKDLYDKTVDFKNIEYKVQCIQEEINRTLCFFEENLNRVVARDKIFEEGYKLELYIDQIEDYYDYFIRLKETEETLRDIPELLGKHKVTVFLNRLYIDYTAMSLNSEYKKNLEFSFKFVSDGSPVYVKAMNGFFKGIGLIEEFIKDNIHELYNLLISAEKLHKIQDKEKYKLITLAYQKPEILDEINKSGCIYIPKGNVKTAFTGVHIKSDGSPVKRVVNNAGAGKLYVRTESIRTSIKKKTTRRERSWMDRSVPLIYLLKYGRTLDDLISSYTPRNKKNQ